PRLHTPSLHDALPICGADLELDEHHAVSLLQVIEEETKRRPYGAAVRVEVAGEMPEAVRELLLRELQFEEAAASSPPGTGDVYADRKSTRLNSSHGSI